jgi:hypothetical protein
MANFKKKPTVNELGNAIVEINNRVNELINVAHNLDNILGMYIRMEGKLDEFNEYLEVKTKEMIDEQKANGKADKQDIQADTKDEGSGSKGVRKKDD